MKKQKNRNIKLVIEYDGTDFFGWQVQPGFRTVQDEIERSFEVLTGEKRRVFGAGRTDAGVHAFGQVAHVHTCSTIPGNRFAMALNAILPQDVAIVSSKEVPLSFHAMKTATGKHYRYMILNRRAFSPISRNRTYCVHEKLDIKKMQKAARFFVGKKDYASFASNRKIKENYERNITEVRVSKKGAVIIIDVKGKSFLYKMVRAIAGTLVEVGKGKDLDVESVFRKKKRASAGPNLPPQGLYMVKVFYSS